MAYGFEYRYIGDFRTTSYIDLPLQIGLSNRRVGCCELFHRDGDDGCITEYYKIV